MGFRMPKALNWAVNRRGRWEETMKSNTGRDKHTPPSDFQGGAAMTTTVRRRLPWLLAAAAILTVALTVMSAGAVGGQGAVPNLTSAQVQGNELYADYDQALDESRTPPANAYVIRINGKRTTVQSVSVSGRRVTLTLESATIEGDAVTFTYRHKTRPTLRSASGVDAGTVRNVDVEVLSPDAVVETVEPVEPESAEQAVSGQAADDFIPTNFTTDILNTGIRFKWGAPSSGTVKGYEIRHDTDSDPSDGTVVQLSSSTVRHDVRPGAGTRVWAQVRAQDNSDDSWGPWSHVLSGTGNREGRNPPAAPDAPTVTAGDGQLTVTWAAPNDNGYSITEYQVQHRWGERGWTVIRNAWKIDTGGALSHTVSGLRNGRPYDVQVRAISAAGQGAWSDATTGTPAAPAVQPTPAPTPEPPSDPTATVAADSASITEGAAAEFTVTLDSAPSSDVTVKYDITTVGSFGVTAATNREVTVSSGETTADISLSTANDHVDEANGSVTVTLVDGTGYDVGDTGNSASVAVNDNDTVGTSAAPVVTVFASDTEIAEGAAVTITFYANPAPDEDTDVFYRIRDGSGFGLETTEQEVAIDAGSTSATVVLQTTPDNLHNTDATVTVALATDVDADSDGYTTGADNSVSVGITQSEAPVVTISAAPATITEGDSITLTFTADEAAPVGGLAVKYVIFGGTDFGLPTQSSVQTATIPATESTVDVTHATTLDTLDTGSDDTVTFSIENSVSPSGADYLRGSPRVAEVTVQQASTSTTDPTATVAAGTSPITEGADATFTVTLNPAPSSAVTVKYNITVSGDYGVTAANDQTVSVGTGGTGTITLTTTDDSVDEANGSVTVTLVDDTGYTLGTTTSATVNVNDNDAVGVTVRPLPSISLTVGAETQDSGLTEGSSTTYTLKLDSQPSGNVVIDIVSSDTDAVTVSPAQMTFTTSNWDTPQSVTITAIQDDDVYDETVTIIYGTNTALTLDNAYDNLTIPSTTVNVTDDEEPHLVFVTGVGNPALVIEPWRPGFTPLVSWEMALSHAPRSNVVIRITSSSPEHVLVDVDDTAPEAASKTITFTPDNWDCEQRVGSTCIGHYIFLEAPHDEDGDEERVTITIEVVAAESDDAFDDMDSITINAVTVDDEA